MKKEAIRTLVEDLSSRVVIAEAQAQLALNAYFSTRCLHQQDPIDGGWICMARKSHFGPHQPTSPEGYRYVFIEGQGRSLEAPDPKRGTTGTDRPDTTAHRHGATEFGLGSILPRVQGLS